MTPYVADSDFTLYVGDVRECLRELPAESVHTVVTSPPYWGLRDYGTGSWEGGEPDCDHKMPATGGNPAQGPNKGNNNFEAMPFKDVCGKCGATRVDQQLGLEPTPEAFVAAMVDVFREVRRVLRDDGTLWLNLGDSYASGSGAGTQGANGQMADRSIVAARASRPRGGLQGGTRTVDVSLGAGSGPGLKPKDLVGIPWRVAFALQADGWYLRSDIVWSKPNPMPESVTDRPTKAHEYVFLLSKSPRYFYDADAIRERVQEWNTPTGRENAAGIASPRHEQRKQAGKLAGGHSYSVAYNNPAGRNVRSVWEIATQPFPEAHFATFPEALPERCIKAGTSERGCCPECGAPWVRVTEQHTKVGNWHDDGKDNLVVGQRQSSNEFKGGNYYTNYKAPTTTGWGATCQCLTTHVARSAPFPHPVPCTVLDPFMGSGTTALVSRRLGRRSIGIELNPEYAALCARRLQQLSLEFA